ncbi:hypothetical protein WJ96_05195 [Burkholderia ubonensis]|uniref:Uncharacterized protein n=1 Tax=Burkholderia ubonensis TaxID=101571 RepID=A0AAW3MY96_9BURK|nr:hypothetical protein WJ97_12105 [Burkholderia ubonensis]KVP97967.1 hypothetical protein WJ96_05195 [Burkholderia ubonensis]KVZ92664.1 hypothetical protein WL25_16850 [Burkholderia ubonensis]
MELLPGAKASSARFSVSRVLSPTPAKIGRQLFLVFFSMCPDASLDSVSVSLIVGSVFVFVIRVVLAILDAQRGSISFSIVRARR